MAHLVIAKVLKHPILFIRQYLETQTNVTIIAFGLDTRKWVMSQSRTLLTLKRSLQHQDILSDWVVSGTHHTFSIYFPQHDP